MLSDYDLELPEWPNSRGKLDSWRSSCYNDRKMVFNTDIYLCGYKHIFMPSHLLTIVGRFPGL